MKRPYVKRRIRLAQTKPQLELSAMVDVVFLLLIFFIVTLKVEDIFAELNVSAPAPASHKQPIEISLFKLHITENDYVVNGKSLSEESLGAVLRKLARYSPTQQITVICDDNSCHAQLVAALDICAREGMENVVLMHR